MRLIGLPVLGTGDELREVVESQPGPRSTSIDEIAVSMPSATGRQIRERGRTRESRGPALPHRSRPGRIDQRQAGSGQHARNLGYRSAGRNPVQVDMDLLRRAITGRSVLVTGAAGSIGTELCFQIAQFEPRHLIALDQAESELFRLEADLTAKYPDRPGSR